MPRLTRASPAPDPRWPRWPRVRTPLTPQVRRADGAGHAQDARPLLRAAPVRPAAQRRGARLRLAGRARPAPAAHARELAVDRARAQRQHRLPAEHRARKRCAPPAASAAPARRALRDGPPTRPRRRPRAHTPSAAQVASALGDVSYHKCGPLFLRGADGGRKVLNLVYSADAQPAGAEAAAPASAAAEQPPPAGWKLTAQVQSGYRPRSAADFSLRALTPLDGSALLQAARKPAPEHLRQVPTRTQRPAGACVSAPAALALTAPRLPPRARPAPSRRAAGAPAPQGADLDRAPVRPRAARRLARRLWAGERRAREAGLHAHVQGARAARRQQARDCGRPLSSSRVLITSSDYYTIYDE